MKRKAQALEEQEDLPSEASEDDTSVTSSGSDLGTSGSDGRGSDSDSDPNQEIDVDFEFFDPQEIDFHGLRALLQTYLDGTVYNCSELVETVIKQVCCNNNHQVHPRNGNLDRQANQHYCPCRKRLAQW